MSNNHPSLQETPQPPYVYTTSPTAFYNGLPLPEQHMWHAKLQSHALASFMAPTTGKSWKVIPRSYMLFEDDQALVEPVQMKMIEGAGEMGGEVEAKRVNAEHSPFLSKCEETVGWVRGVAEE